MSTENNNQDGGATDQGAGDEKAAEAGTQTIAELEALKAELSKRDETIGSLKRENKDLKKANETKETPQPNAQQSNEPDYARLAFLKSHQVEHPDDQKLVMDEAARLKLPLTDVLGMEHIKAGLTRNNDTRVSQAGMPNGTNRQGGPNKGEVDYYLAHPDEHPEDLELHNKVIDAKLAKEKNANMFSSVPFIG